jgi:large subunit ribosomal protein L25
MKTVQLSGSPRANVGKKDAKAVRNSGRVPCVLYGTGEQIYFSVRNIDMQKIVVSPDVYIVELDIEGTKKTGIIQELQMHPVKDSVQHVDFLELVDNKPVVVGIPVKLVGRSKGVLNGGRLQQVFRRLKVQALPKDLPSEIEIDITPIKIGQSRRVSDVVLPGVTMLDPQNAVVVSVKRARGAVLTDEEEEEAAAAEAASDAADAAEEAAAENA